MKKTFCDVTRKEMTNNEKDLRLDAIVPFPVYTDNVILETGVNRRTVVHVGIDVSATPDSDVKNPDMSLAGWAHLLRSIAYMLDSEGQDSDDMLVPESLSVGSFIPGVGACSRPVPSDGYHDIYDSLMREEWADGKLVNVFSRSFIEDMRAMYLEMEKDPDTAKLLSAGATDGYPRFLEWGAYFPENTEG